GGMRSPVTEVLMSHMAPIPGNSLVAFRTETDPIAELTSSARSSIGVLRSSDPRFLRLKQVSSVPEDASKRWLPPYRIRVLRAASALLDFSASVETPARDSLPGFRRSSKHRCAPLA